MNKIIYLVTLLATISIVGCKKFLNITPIDNLSGNNYWKSESDVERFTVGLYAQLRTKMSSTGNQMNLAADVRCAPVVLNLSSTQAMANNDLKTSVTAPNSDWGPFLFKQVPNWKPWFDVIQGANILYYEVGKMDAGLISDDKRKTYLAEAVFLRNFCYFQMVRLYGDVPYYTNAYNEKALPRTDQVEVMKQCIADMSAVKGDLPINYEDKSKNCIRAMRGGAIALLMHMNMWAASFERGDKTPYYQSTIDLCNELLGYQQYSLVAPLTAASNKQLFKGGTSESLFEILSNVNYNEALSTYSNQSFMFSYYPYYGNVATTQSNGFYTTAYMNLLFPQGVPDIRRDLWFTNPNIGSRAFQLRKYTNTLVSGSNNNVTHDDNMIIFRLADAMLLGAEAASDLNQDEVARGFANPVRARAGATPFVNAGNDLAFDIFEERCRELFCEGQYFYDLVRTRRVFPGVSTGNGRTRPGSTITPTDFNAGAWTWPINADALTNNPYMTLNNFWR